VPTPYHLLDDAGRHTGNSRSVTTQLCNRGFVLPFSFRQSGAVDEPTVQAESDRYISWPAQALSYKLGQLKFRELRDRAQRELGPKFDIRGFHDEMLSGGVLPLDLLDSRTTSWIYEQKFGAKSTAAN
jgi:Bacterial protein of unknown function (DUF885)